MYHVNLNKTPLHTETTLTWMGAIISKLCYSCCGRSKNNLKNPTKSKLSRNPSLIIERTQIIIREDEEKTEYSRVLERDFEIKGRRVLGKSRLTEEVSATEKENDVYDDAIKVKLHNIAIVNYCVGLSGETQGKWPNIRTDTDKKVESQ